MQNLLWAPPIYQLVYINTYFCFLQDFVFLLIRIFDFLLEDHRTRFRLLGRWPSEKIEFPLGGYAVGAYFDDFIYTFGG